MFVKKSALSLHHFMLIKFIKSVKASSHIDDMTQYDSMRHDPIFHLPFNLSSHICSMTNSCRHKKKLLQQKSLLKGFLSYVTGTLSRKLLKKKKSMEISLGFVILWRQNGL